MLRDFLFILKKKSARRISEKLRYIDSTMKCNALLPAVKYTAINLFFFFQIKHILKYKLRK